MEELLRAMRKFMETFIKDKEMPDEDALVMTVLHPKWQTGIQYKAGERLKHNGKLYKVALDHTSQADWEPGVAQTLYTRIDEAHAGTLADPIPYEGNMSLENGKHYAQDGKVYLCFRDTGNPVFDRLEALVGLYVNEVAA